VCSSDLVATMRWVTDTLGRSVGPSTGTNVWAALQVMERMVEAGEEGSVVTLLCDGGERYATTYYDNEWLAGKGIDPAPYALI
jgi:cysteine synthase A